MWLTRKWRNWKKPSGKEAMFAFGFLDLSTWKGSLWVFWRSLLHLVLNLVQVGWSSIVFVAIVLVPLVGLFGAWSCMYTCVFGCMFSTYLFLLGLWCFHLLKKRKKLPFKYQKLEFWLLFHELNLLLLHTFILLLAEHVAMLLGSHWKHIFIQVAYGKVRCWEEVEDFFFTCWNLELLSLHLFWEFLSFFFFNI